MHFRSTHHRPLTLFDTAGRETLVDMSYPTSSYYVVRIVWEFGTPDCYWTEAHVLMFTNYNLPIGSNPFVPNELSDFRGNGFVFLTRNNCYVPQKFWWFSSKRIEMVISTTITIVIQKIATMKSSAITTVMICTFAPDFHRDCMALKIDLVVSILSLV